jgi:hypothetical protein
VTAPRPRRLRRPGGHPARWRLRPGRGWAAGRARWEHTDQDGDTLVMRALPPAGWRPDVVAVVAVEPGRPAAAYVTLTAARSLYNALGDVLGRASRLPARGGDD